MGVLLLPKFLPEQSGMGSPLFQGKDIHCPFAQ